MDRSRYAFGPGLTAVAALGYVVTAWIHSTGFDGVTALAAEGPEEMVLLMPALWLAFSLDLIVLALILALSAFRPARRMKWVVGIAAFCPLGAAALQVRYIGFIPPTAILLTIGTLAVAAAVVMDPRPDASTGLGG